jgi:hypothetical protein
LKNELLFVIVIIFSGIFLGGCSGKKSKKYRNVEQVRALEIQDDLKYQIVPRNEWTDEGPDETNITPMAPIYRLTIHHTAMPDDELPDEIDTKIRLQKILTWHKQNNKWADMGYHFVIDADGKVWEGRNIKYQGAHAGSETLNVGNVGIVLIGNFDTHELPEIQRQALFDFVQYLKNKYKIESKNIFGHDHFKDTKCPGKFVMPYVEQLRKE